MSTNDNRHPLSYADLRRWLGLIILTVIACTLIVALQSVLLLFAIVFLIAIVLNPFIAALEKRGLKRPIAVALLMIVVLALLTAAVWFVIPNLLDQLGQFVSGMPGAAGRLQDQWRALATKYPVLQQLAPQGNDLAGTVAAQFGGVAKFLLRSTFTFAGGIFAFAMGLLLLVFVLSNPQPLVRSFLELMPESQREPARRSLVRLMFAMRAWARGVCINGAAVGVSIGLLMSVIGVQPALVFGALGFLGEFIPNVGGVVAALPPLFVALSISGSTFGITLLAILFIYQVETNLLVPLILGKEMELNPVSILFFTLAMASLFGFAGAILAVPAAAAVKIVVEEFYLSPRKLDHAKLEAEARKIVTNQATAKD